MTHSERFVMLEEYRAHLDGLLRVERSP